MHAQLLADYVQAATRHLRPGWRPVPARRLASWLEGDTGIPVYVLGAADEVLCAHCGCVEHEGEYDQHDTTCVGCIDDKACYYFDHHPFEPSGPVVGTACWVHYCRHAEHRHGVDVHGPYCFDCMDSQPRDRALHFYHATATVRWFGA